MVKLWISDKLELRYSLTGWPDKYKFGWLDKEGFDGDQPGWTVEGGEDAYYIALAKAKEESVPAEDQYYLKRHLLELVDFTPNHVVDDLWKGSRFKPDTFVEVDEEILKPVNSAMSFTEGSDPGVGKYYEKAHGSDPEGEAFNSGLDKTLNIGQQLEAANKTNDELSTYLDATLKRVKELEQWKKEQLLVFGPILDYCHDEANAKRLGIGLGQSISTRILEILKDVK